MLSSHEMKNKLNKLPVIYVSVLSAHRAGRHVEIRGEGLELIDSAVDYMEDNPSDTQVALLESLAKNGYIKLVKDKDALKIWP